MPHDPASSPIHPLAASLAAARPSAFAASAAARIGLVLAVLALLWLAVAWAAG